MKSRLDREHRADYETEWAAMRMSRRSGRWPAGIVPPVGQYADPAYSSGVLSRFM